MVASAGSGASVYGEGYGPICLNRPKELLDALPEKPNQPHSFSFHKRKYLKKSVVERSRQSSWFNWTTKTVSYGFVM